MVCCLLKKIVVIVAHCCTMFEQEVPIFWTKKIAEDDFRI